MGQARMRGTLDERIENAKTLQKDKSKALAEALVQLDCLTKSCVETPTKEIWDRAQKALFDLGVDWEGCDDEPTYVLRDWDDSYSYLCFDDFSMYGNDEGDPIIDGYRLQTVDYLEKLYGVIKDACNELGLPSNGKFLGFVIHLPDQDEFVGAISDNNMSLAVTYAKIPELAKRYTLSHLAFAEAKKITKYKTLVCVLFETPEQYFISDLNAKHLFS